MPCVICCSPQAFLDNGKRCGNFEHLVAPSLAPDDGDASLWHTENVGKEGNERRIRRPLDGWRGEANAERTCVGDTVKHVAAGARHDADWQTCQSVRAGQMQRIEVSQSGEGDGFGNDLRLVAIRRRKEGEPVAIEV